MNRFNLIFFIIYNNNVIIIYIYNRKESLLFFIIIIGGFLFCFFIIIIVATSAPHTMASSHGALSLTEVQNEWMWSDEEEESGRVVWLTGAAAHGFCSVRQHSFVRLSPRQDAVSLMLACS